MTNLLQTILNFIVLILIVIIGIKTKALIEINKK